MRRQTWAAALALSITAVIGIGACSSPAAEDDPASGSANDEQPTTDSAPVVDRDPDFELPKVEGPFGEIPQVTPVDIDPPKDITYKLLIPGDGPELHANGIVTVQYSGFLWDGKPFGSSFETGAPATFSLNGVIPAWTYGLEGSRVGDRVLLIAPPKYAYGATGQGAIPGDATLIFVVDILAVPGSDLTALKEAVPTDQKLPDGLMVDGQLGEIPVLGFEEGVAAPTDSTEVVLAEGKGAVITSADTVVYHYTAVYWGTPNSADSTWQSGPTTIPAAGSVFLGHKVGSRIAMVFPPESGDGPASVMIIDVVAAYQ